jgi:hypothetical protein
MKGHWIGFRMHPIDDEEYCRVLGQQLGVRASFWSSSTGCWKCRPSGICSFAFVDWHDGRIPEHEADLQPEHESSQTQSGCTLTSSLSGLVPARLL